jgi:hypothetical protein
VEDAVRAHSQVINFAEEVKRSGSRSPDNDHVVALASTLTPQSTLFLFQPRIVAQVGQWNLRGDIDLLRLERDAQGGLHLLITDMKSSTTARVEHRLQVAFYHTMLATLLDKTAVPYVSIRTAILYRGANTPDPRLTPEQLLQLQEQQDAARDLFGVSNAFLEMVPNPDAYLQSVEDLVTGPQSTTERVMAQPFDAIPYHLTYKCDGCLYNEFCMKRTAEREDLSLLPHLTALDKEALRRTGITTVRQLAYLKDLPPEESNTSRPYDLIPAEGMTPLVRRIAATWPVAPRIDELVHRAKRYRRWRNDNIRALTFIPSKGHGSLPYCDSNHNPNLVKVYIDVQHDYLYDRIYMLGALVVACEDGKEVSHRRRSIVRLSDSSPDSEGKEEALFVSWIGETLEAVVELAAPDPEGNHRAPIHLVFYDAYVQQTLLDGLARHLPKIFGATPMYDFITQLAAFDSPISTFLEREIRDLKNYPMVCQSLQSVAAYLKFDWNKDKPFRELFHARLFDFWGKLDPDPTLGTQSLWYTNRSRFSSQIPLEYAYAAWDELPSPAEDKDDLAPYRAVTPTLLAEFQERRLHAIEHIAHDFRGNHLTQKTPFNLPDLSTFASHAPTLAHALLEFNTVERHVELAAWKSARNAAPERRVLTGETFLVRYLEEDQLPEVAALNRDAWERYHLREQFEAEYLQRNPGADKAQLTKDQRKACEWSLTDQVIVLRVETTGTDADLGEILAMTNLRQGDRVLLYPRYVVDSRLPVAERTFNTPTPKQMLYGPRADVEHIVIDRDPSGTPQTAYVHLRMAWGSGASLKGFLFASFQKEPFTEGALYTLDPDPSDIYGYWSNVVAEELCHLAETGNTGRHTLYTRLSDPSSAPIRWDNVSVEAQSRFLEGLDALHTAGALHTFEESKRNYIGSHGADPVLLVQGPPGTGKSYSTAFAVLARLQGALAADRSYRVFLSCKTHAATDVLLQNVLAAQQKLLQLSQHYPSIFAHYFDPRLLTLPILRIAPRQLLDGVLNLSKDADKPKGDPRNADIVASHQHCIVAATPGSGIYGMVKDKWTNKDLSGHYLCHLLVLDEASQMNLPESCMAALILDPDGQLIVVGDPRQMPPIVKHDWASERRRTFQEYKSYRSLFETLLDLNPQPPMIKFSESFRLHADMAEFLRREIYSQDGIAYHSQRHDVLPAFEHSDPFVAAVLSPDHPIIVIVHDEAQSQTRNHFEQSLISPILQVLVDPDIYNYDPVDGIGVVVPHRAQRADLQSALPMLNQLDPLTGTIRFSAADTVERFQGGERTAILVSATESDQAFILAASDFLYDPRRLTVAISRAKQKMILIASRSIFSLFSPEEGAFANAQLWKNLLRRTCTVNLWKGHVHDTSVEVWGNQPSGNTC